MYTINEIDVSYKPLYETDNKSICKPGDAAKIFRKFFKAKGLQIQHKEYFIVMCLDRSANVLGLSKVSEGARSGCVVDPVIIFQVGIKANASSLIVCHNHPSGNTKISPEDIRVTKKLVDGGKILEMQVKDHIILTADSYVSLADLDMI